MKIFLDTADISAIESCLELGLVDGITTNPTLIAKSGRKYIDVLQEISSMVDGPISAEVISETYDLMLEEAYKLYETNKKNIVVKLPLVQDALKVAVKLIKDGIPVNFTLCFSTSQAILVAKLGVSYVSPFVGRIDDISFSGMDLIEDIVSIYGNYNKFNTQVIVASIRHLTHVLEAARLGADIITIPPKLLYDMIKHPLTDKGLEIFRNAGIDIL